MKHSNIDEERILELCDSVNPDDGMSPHELAKRNRNRQSGSNRERYRFRQLCRQVMHGIDDALLCHCCDPLLSDLRTIDVRPASNSSVLEATLVTPESSPDKIELIQKRLESASGLIRASIGAVITRKRVPRIRFRVIPESIG